MSLFFELASEPFGNSQQDAFAYLLYRGADISLEGKSRWGELTPLQAAVAKKDLDLAEWLMDQGADINHINRINKSSVLEFVVATGEKDNVLWALKHGATVQEKERGRSLLRFLLRRKDTDEIIDLLIEKGADLYFDVESKNSPIDWLAKERDLIRLKARDSRGIYQALIDEYTPPKDSPFVGSWLKKRRINLILTPDGHAFMRGYHTIGPFLWKATKEKQATIEVTMKELREDWIVEWVEESDAVRLFQQGTNHWGLLLKQEEEPPTAMEYIERYRSENNR